MLYKVCVVTQRLVLFSLSWALRENYKAGKSFFFLKFNIVKVFLLNDFFQEWVDMGIFDLTGPEEIEKAPQRRIKTSEKSVKETLSFHSKVS